MLIWIFIGMAVVGFLVWWLDYKFLLSYSWLSVLSGVCVTIGIVMAIILGVYGLIARCDRDAFMDEEIQKYESLMYRYDHETDLVKRSETITEIAEWNDDVTWGRKNQHNFWYGFLIPDIYDELEYIELD